MAERQLPDLRSRVRIDTGDIDKASLKAKALGDTVRAQGDATQPLQRGFRVTQDQMAQFGASMTRYVTLPVAAGAAVALKMSSNFETTFTQMQGLAGVTADEVDGLRQRVLDLAGETAQAPQTLAEGLYFIRSAGLDGQDAIEALTSSAKAAAVGLGETSQVADAVTSAMNSYGADTLSAAQATDTLVAAVREGKGEASAMAPQLGRLLPIAANLGVEFGEVAGGLAFLTRGNGDAAQSATQLNGVMQKILRPTQQAKDALSDAGISVDQLRRVVREDGLLAALQLLDGTLGQNSDGFKAVFDDTEGLTGALALLRDGGTEAAGVIDSVTNSSGDLQEAFDGLSETDAFQQRQALAELQSTAIEAGAKMAPVLTDIAEMVGDVVGMFADLPSGLQTAIIVFAGITAAIGPVVSTATAANKAISAISSAMAGASVAGGVFAAAAVGVGLLVGAFVSAKIKAQEAQRQIDDLANAAATAGKTADEVFRERLARSFAGFDDGLQGGGVGKAIDGLKELGYTASEIADGITGTQEAYDAFRADVAQNAIDHPDLDIFWAEDLSEGIGNMRRASQEAEAQQRELEAANHDLGVETETATTATEDAAGAADDAAAAADAQAEATARSEAAMHTAAEKARILADAYSAAEDSLNSLTDSVLAGFSAELNYRDSLRDFAGAQDAVTLAEADIRINGWTPERQATLEQARRDLERATVDLADSEVAWAEAQAEANGETLNAEDRTDVLIDSLQRMSDTLAPDSPLRQRLTSMIDDLREIAGDHHASLTFGLHPDRQFGSWLPSPTLNPPTAFGSWSPTPLHPPDSFFRLSTPAAKGPASATPTVNIVVNGEPDSGTLRRLHRVASDAVRKGLVDAGREVGQW